MIFDFSYVNIFFKAINREISLNEVEKTLGFRTIQTHALKTGNSFSIAHIKKALSGEKKAGYGLKDLAHNLVRIKGLTTLLRDRQSEWEEIVNREVAEIFNGCNLDNIIICPVIGYDIGIGINDVVCLNMNSPFYFREIREVFSLSIHETAHIVFEKLNPMTFSVASKADLKSTIDYLIHYEGIGIFAAKRYREQQKLLNEGVAAIEDYHLSPEYTAQLKRLYATIQELIISRTSSLDNIISTAFSSQRLAHRLGYALVHEIYIKYGIAEVREAAMLPSKDFIQKYLYPLA